MTEQVPETELAKPPTEATADLSHGERDFPKETEEEEDD